MPVITDLPRQLKLRHAFAVPFLSLVVGLHGLFVLANTLLAQIAVHHSTRLSDFVVDIPLLFGVSLIYLSTLLRRRKHTAWLVAVGAYTLYLLFNLGDFFGDARRHELLHEPLRAIILPLLIVGALWVFRREYVVRSDIQGFRLAARFSAIILLVALLYGTFGFLLLDNSDFHQEIGVPAAIHYTIDQFDLTTTRPLQPHTKRAHLFVDSLSFVSVVAVGYVVISLFQPIRLRLTNQTALRARAAALLTKYGGVSEDFFKLWPHDKHYFFDATGQSFLAYHVRRGVALCLGDPIGNKQRFASLMREFEALCFSNDWSPAFIHVQKKQQALYKKHGFELQVIGQEAVVDIGHFQAEVRNNKYFRHIRNRFTKQHFMVEVLEPPHHQAVIDRLRHITHDWLRRDGHVERGYVMGYFTPEYMQQCRLVVVRDAAGTIQAFLNQIPANFDKQEATFDMFRQADGSAGNINDFLVLGLLDRLAEEGYTHLNLGLCPLAGLDQDKEKGGLIDSALRFAYANGDRFYSFSGLYRFKAKYEPAWRDRYIAYQGGVRGFSRTMTALMLAMRTKRH